MGKVKVVLKSIEDITSMCSVDGEGNLIYKEVLFKPSQWENGEAYTVIAITKYPNVNPEWAFKLQRGESQTHIHIDWISHLEFMMASSDGIGSMMASSDGIGSMMASSDGIGSMMASSDGIGSLDGGELKKYKGKIRPSLNNQHWRLGKKYVLDTNICEVFSKETLKKCPSCGGYFDKSVITDGMCRQCFINKHYKVHHYSFKPSPTFFGKQKSYNSENPVWYGVELEIGFNDNFEVAKVAKENKKLLYLKSDSSIISGEEGGVEIVSHPMSFEYAISKYTPLFNKLDVVDSDANGVHIHVNRSAFKDDKHYAFTTKFIVESARCDVLQRIGGRELTNYCELPSGSKHIADFKSTGKDNFNSARRGLINENNDNTVEFRFFASSVKEKDLKRYIQFLESVIKYTRYHSKYITYEGWIKYINKYKEKYKELKEFIENNKLGDYIVNGVIYRNKKYKSLNIHSIKMKDMCRIEKVILNTGDIFYVDTTQASWVDDNKLYVREKEDWDHKGIRLDTIKEVVICVGE